MVASPRIGQIAITVSDVAVALPFYRDILGLTFLFSAGPSLVGLMEEKASRAGV
jgi:predicted enzyme related to lactoylglutathione lyase